MAHTKAAGHVSRNPSTARNDKRNNQRLIAMLFASATAGIGATRLMGAPNVVSNYTGGASIASPASGNWSTVANWDTLPVSGLSTELDFNGSGGTAYTSTNNIGTTPFTLTMMQLNSTATVSETIAAFNASQNSFVFSNVAGNPGAQILQNGSGAFRINPAMNASGGALTVAGTGTGTVTLGGAITGSGLNDNFSAGSLVLSGSSAWSKTNLLNIGAGSTLTSTGTLSTLSDGSLHPNPVITGAGTLALRSTTNNATTSPDIYFNSNDSKTNSTANWGTQINVPVDLGSSQRYIWGLTNHNGVGNYGLNGDCVFTKTISGTGGMTFVAQSTYTGGSSMEVPFYLAASNSFTGPVEIQRGSVYLGTSNSLAQGNVLNFDPASGNGANLFLFGNNASVTNLTSSGAGTAAIINSPGQGTIAPATLTVTQNSATTFSGSILQTQREYVSSITGTSGALSLNKLGPATLTLNGSNSYTGYTNISGGSLILGTRGVLGTTAVNVATGSGYLARIGTATANVGGSLNLATGSTFDMVDKLVGAAVLNGTGTAINFAGNDSLNFDIGFASADSLTATGAASFNGVNTVNLTTPSAGVLLNNTYNLITAGSVTGAGAFQFSNGSTTQQFQIAGQGTTYTAALATTATGVQLIISGAVTDVWKGSASSDWTGANWTSDQAGTLPTAIPNSSANVIFSVTGGGANSANTTLGQDFSIASLSFTGDANQPVVIGGANNLTVASGGITITAGSGSHTISTGSLVLGGSQTWTNNSTQTFTVTAPITGAAGSNDLTLGGTGPFIFTGNNAYGATTIPVGSSLTIGNGGVGGSLGTGTVTNNGSLTFNESSDLVVAPSVTGTGTITQAGTGTTTLSSPLVSGPVNINSGALILNGNNTTGTMTVNTGTNLTVNGSIKSTWINANASNVNVSGGVTVSGTSANNNVGIYLTGGANMSAGGIVNIPALGQLNISSGSTFSSAGTLNLLVSQSGSAAHQNVTGGGTLRLTGTGNSAANPDLFFGPDHSGTAYYGALMTVGTLDLGSTQRYFSSNTGHNSVANYLYPSVNVDGFISSNIVGTAGFNYTAGPAYSGAYAGLVLYGSNTFTGPVEIDRGSIYLYGANSLMGQNQLTLSNNDAIGTSYSHFFLLGNDTTVTNLASAGATPGNTGIANGNPTMKLNPGSIGGATLTINQTTNTVFAGAIADTLSDNYDYTGAGPAIPGQISLKIAGTGNLTLSGKSTFTGNTTVGSTGTPTLSLTSGASLVSTNIAVNPGATFAPAPGSSIGTITSGTQSATLNINGGVLDMTAGGTISTVGNFAIHEPVTSGNTVLTLNNATLNFAATVAGPDTIMLDGPGSVSGTNIINIMMLGSDPALPATYNLISAPGGLTGIFQFSNGTATQTVPYGTGTITLGLINTSGAEELTINGGALQPLNAYWSGSHGTVWTTGGNGVAATNFTTDDTGTTELLYLPGSTTNVFFSTNAAGPTPLTTTLGADLSINSLTFTAAATGGVMIGGSNQLTIGSGGIQAAVGSGQHQISTGALVIGSSQSWANNTNYPLTITSNVSGADLTISGISPVVLTSNNNTYGKTTVNAGSILQLGNGGSTGNTGSGAVTVNGQLVYNIAGNTAPNITGLLGTGTVVQAGGGTWTLTPANLPAYTYAFDPGDGTVTGTGTGLGIGVTNGTLIIPTMTLPDIGNSLVGPNGTLVSNGTLTVGHANNDITIASGGRLISNGQLLLNGSTGSNVTTIAGSGTLVLNSSAGSLAAPDLLSQVISNAYYAIQISANIELSAGTHYIGGTSGNNSWAKYHTGDLGLEGSLSGSGDLVIAGKPSNSQFEVVLANNNSSWTGNLTITQGDIAAVVGGAINSQNNVTLNPSSGNTAALYIFGTNQTIGNLSGTGAGSMYIRNGNSSTGANLTVTQSLDGTFGGVISNGPDDYYAGTSITTTFAPLGIAKDGPAVLTLTGLNTYTGPTTVLKGQLIFAPAGTGVQVETISTAAGTGITINAGASVVLANASTRANHTLLVTGGLSMSGSTGAWTSRLDLGNSDIDVRNGVLNDLTDQVAQGYAGGTWNGSNGISSSAAFGDPSHLTALGVIQNSVDGTPGGTALYSNVAGSNGLFDGKVNPASTDVLVKFTYYGDTNLDGKIDGTDYSRIDASFLAEMSGSGPVTGWYNGDFNYDGLVNGSDYTLLDNAFNQQGATLTAQIATPTGQLAGGAGSSVPEPTTLSVLGLGAVGLLGRRRRK